MASGFAAVTNEEISQIILPADSKYTKKVRKFGLEVLPGKAWSVWLEFIMDNRKTGYRKLMSRERISYGRLVVSCSEMALDGSIIVEIRYETMAKMWRKQVEM